MIASGGTTLDSTLSESEVKGPPAPDHRSNKEGDCRLPKPCKTN